MLFVFEIMRLCALKLKIISFNENYHNFINNPNVNESKDRELFEALKMIAIFIELLADFNGIKLK